MKRNIMKKWMLVLAVALCLNTAAFAEGDEPVAPAAPAQVEQVNEEQKVEAPQPVVEEKKVETEVPAEPAPVQAEAAAPAEEVSATVEAPAEPAAPAEVEVPAEPEAPAEVEAPAEPEAEIPEQTEAPIEVTEAVPEAGSEEIADEAAPAPADDGTVEIDDYETPLGVTPDPVPFDATVQLQLRNQGEIYYGDTVTIEANVTGATGAYAIRWEVDRHDENGWSVIDGQNGSSYGFVITENNASYDYRVVLTGQA